MPSFPQPSSLNGPVSLSLRRLSFSTTPTLQSRPVWEHLTAGADMFAVFDHVQKTILGRAISEKWILKLVQGVNLLGEIDLETLSFQVGIDDERFKSQQIRDSERRVVVLIKRPMVALRHQLMTGEVSRFQMNFHPESGYDIALNIFRANGLPISDMNEPPPGSQGGIKRPGSTLQPNNQLLQRHPQLVDNTQMTLELSRISNDSYHNESQEFGIISDSNKMSQSSGPLYHQIQPGHFDSSERPTRNLKSAGSTSLPSTLSVSEQNTTYPSHQVGGLAIGPQRPATAPLNLTQLMPPRRELPLAMRLSGSAVAQKAAIENNEDESPRQAAKKPASRGKAKAKKQPSRPTTSGETAKPASSRETIMKPTIRPTSSRTAARPGSRPGSTKGESLVDNLDAQPATAAQHTLTSMTDDLSTPTTGNHQMLTSVAPEQPSTMNSMLPPSTFPTDPIPDPLTCKSPPRTTLPQVPNPNSLAGNSITAPPTTTTSLPSSPIPVASNTENITEEEYFARLDHWVRKYHNATPGPIPNSTTIPATTDAAQLAAYAAQPEKLRLEVIDTMICECLADPNFEKLMEDVEKTWRRVELEF
ncbi:MAG: hypothetical protein Q9182_005114 [Xanthomendoza sp. 2 TL-2023]